MLDAALALIVEQGYAAVTMEAVARRLDLAKTVVYNAFPGRDQLLDALLRREAAKALATFFAALPQDDDGETVADALGTALRWVEAVATAIASDPTAWRLILLPPDETPSQVREAVDGGRAVVTAQIEAMMAPLLDARPDLREIDRELLALSLLAVCEQGARQLLARPEEFPVERVVRFARGFLAALVD